MSSFENQMKEALRRREPPAGFTERVLAKAAEQEAHQSPFERFAEWFRGPRLRWAGALAAIVLIVAGAQYYNVRQERIRGEQAKEKVLLALRITADQLQFTRQKVLKITATEMNR